MYCDNMNVENCGFGCQKLSDKRHASGEWCDDFEPDEHFTGVGIKILKMIMEKSGA